MRLELGHLDAVEEDLGGVLSLQADFRDELSGQTLGVGFDEQEADALVGLLGVGSVWTATTKRSATMPLEMKVLQPLTT